MAIGTALGACRPLLVRGEPGVGKTQLAAAAAKVLGRPIVQKVVESRRGLASCSGSSTRSSGWRRPRSPGRWDR